MLSEVAYCRFAGYNIDQTIGDYAKNHAEIMLFHELTKKKDRKLVTFELGNGEYCIAFRGTDSSVTGWKEDFNLSFRNDVEAQKAAVNKTISKHSRGMESLHRNRAKAKSRGKDRKNERTY